MFVVVEIQKDGAEAVPFISLYSDKEDAYSVYHTILAAASISQHDEHSAILISEEGSYMFHEKYTHESEEE